MKNKKGISLIVLVITIIVMIILASAIIISLDNTNIFNKAQKAVDDTKTVQEKQIVTQSALLAKAEDNGREIKYENLKRNLDELAGDEKTIVYDTGDAFEIFFKDSGSYYEIGKKGNVGGQKTPVKDKGVANVFLDENGNDLDGTKEEPYQINCIEDLVMLSNISRGVGNYIDKDSNIVEIENYNAFKNKNFELTRTLNFKSPTSYSNLNLKWSYDAENDAYIIDETSNTNLMEIITDKNGVGFVPIGINSGDGNEIFSGVIDGKCHEIQNIYENRIEIAGLLSIGAQATIKNLGLTGELIGSGNASSFGTKVSTLYNCYSTAKITSPSIAGGLSIIGSKMINCYFNGEVISEKSACGLGSYRNAINCYNSGIVSGLGGHAWWPVAGVFSIITDGSAKCINTCSLRIDFYKK